MADAFERALTVGIGYVWALLRLLIDYFKLFVILFGQLDFLIDLNCDSLHRESDHANHKFIEHIHVLDLCLRAHLKYVQLVQLIQSVGWFPHGLDFLSGFLDALGRWNWGLGWALDWWSSGFFFCLGCLWRIKNWLVAILRLDIVGEDRQSAGCGLRRLLSRFLAIPFRWGLLMLYIVNKVL